MTGASVLHFLCGGLQGCIIVLPTVHAGHFVVFSTVHLLCDAGHNFVLSFLYTMMLVLVTCAILAGALVLDSQGLAPLEF